MQSDYIQSVQKQFSYYKQLGDQTFDQLNEVQFFSLPTGVDNSMAIILHHIAGNMLSRWTNFYTEDGEKSWRNRDREFTNVFTTKEDALAYWDKGWSCLFKIIDELKAEDLQRIVYIRNQGHTVVEAINRQLCHYAYHIGQLVFLGKMLKEDQWKSLSIPKNESSQYNKRKFSKDKHRGHFTDDLMI